MDSDSSSGHEKSRIDVEAVSVDALEEFTPQEAKRIIARVDRRLVTVTGVMYCISVMDRTNLGSAAIAGLLKDLDLVGNRYVSIIQPWDSSFHVRWTNKAV
jgi:hypothetical protein